MNFKKYHVSKNLFDKDNQAMYFDHTSLGYGGVWIALSAGIPGIVLRIPCSPSTTYAISLRGEYTQSVWNIELTSSDNTPTENNPVATSTITNIKPLNLTTVFTTLANTKYILLQLSSVYINSGGTDNIMLNTGSQPLPYEPYSSDVWHDTPHYIMGTSTDTITTLPAVIYANDNNATVGLKGDMEQSGTPTPSSPIQPQECGERTGNLLDKLQIVPISSKTTIEQVPNGVIVENTVAAYGGKITLDVEQNTQYCLAFEKEIISGNYTGYVIVFAGTSQSTQLAKATQTPSGRCTFNTGGNTKVNIWFYIAGDAIGTIKYYNIMLNKGDDYLEYEPYGQYKIPILSNGITTNVYLGEVPTMRRIQKLVLTGEEDWSEYPNKSCAYQVNFSTGRRWAATGSVCTHYSLVPNTESLFNNKYTMSQDTLYIKNDSMLSLTDFKSHLAEQYAAGTPVTIWYVLLPLKTAVVNEPLRKIGTYADEVSGVTIPTIAGANTIDVDTTLKPSEVSVNYHGWHPVADVHERENGAWT